MICWSQRRHLGSDESEGIRENAAKRREQVMPITHYMRDCFASQNVFLSEFVTDFDVHI